MPKQVQLRRGTTAQHVAFTGAAGEVTVDTTKSTAVVHDGATAGGIPLAKESDYTTLKERVDDFGLMSFAADVAIAVGTIVKVGSDSSHVAVCTSSDVPFGVAVTAAASAGDSLDILLLGCSVPGVTVSMISYGGTIAFGALVERAVGVASDGKVQTLSGSTGTHYIVGRTLEAASSGEVIDVIPLFFTKTV